MPENYFKEIPDDFLGKWQDMADLLAKIIDVPAALVMKTENEFMEVFISSNSHNNPYNVGDKEHWHGLYCETVIRKQQKLLVPNALQDKDWNKNPDIRLGMIAYLGLPINFPDNTPFGTLCVLDSKENAFRTEHEQLLKQFKDVIESDLARIQSMNAQKKVKEELQSKTEQFELAIRGTNDGIWDWNLETNEVYLSERWKDMLGYEDHELKNDYDTFASLVFESDRRHVNEHLQRYLDGIVQEYALEFRMKHKDGSLRWILAKGEALRDDRGRPCRMAGSHSDITKRKQAEEALRLSEEKFRSLADTAKVAISIVADASGAKYLYVNNEWSHVHGYSKEEAQNLRPIDLVAPDYRQQVLENAANRIAGKPSPSIYELKTITRSGEVKYLEFSSTIISYENQKAFLTTGIEITKRKHAEDALRKSESQLRELNAQKDKFFSIIAHDLKSPFNAIMGFSELLMDQINEKDYSEAERHAAIILRSSQNAVDLIQNLLDWAGSQTDKMEFAPGHFELAHLIEQTLTEQKSAADQKSIKLLNDIQEQLPVFANKNMTGTVIRNLVSNAIKFTREGGAVHISAQKASEEIIVRVKDNGVGIDSKRIEGLFSIDANLSTPGTNKEKGTGLGLILCKEFVEKHGGKIWVESEAGKGSEFYFTLPMVTVSKLG